MTSNYHPVLLRWQISNMIFCIPVNGKTVKFDKLTNKPEKIRKSVVVSCSLKNKSWCMQWRDGKYRKEKDGCERWEIRRKGKNKCAIPGEPQEVHGMYEIPHWLIVPHLHLLQKIFPYILSFLAPFTDNVSSSSTSWLPILVLPCDHYSTLIQITFFQIYFQTYLYLTLCTIFTFLPTIEGFQFSSVD